METKLPSIGDRVRVYGIACQVVAIHPMGTIDVEAIEGAQAYRVTGLWMPGWPTATVRA